MSSSIVSGLLADNIKVLRSETTKAAYQGVGIALAAILVASVIAGFMATGNVSLDAIWNAQKSNPVLWVIDLMPFVFGFWGQYSSTMIAYKAGAMVVDQTQELRLQAGNLEKQQVFISTHDQLTNLPNRDMFYEQVNKVISSLATVEHSQQQLALILIEIENYNDIYDTLGKSSGDIIIKQVVERFQEIRRTKEQIGRIEGNVFGVLLFEDKKVSRAEEFVRETQKSIESPFLVNRLYIGINVLAGIVKYPEHGEHVELLVQRAGYALHVARHTSKGYAYYEKAKEQPLPMRLGLISDLRHALVKGGLELFYQPQISLKSDQVCGVEALLRWNHPEYGYIPPHDLIPMADRNRMFQLTQWVLRRAFLDCAKWRSQGVELIVSVNLSSKDLLNPELPDYVLNMAVASKIKSAWIMFEISEHSFVSESSNAMKVMERLREMGYRFVLDNYGTGASSLGHLIDLPISGIKIDKSYVARVNQKGNVATIVKTTVNLAHDLGFKITANGVETEDVLASLNMFGCDMAQGYYFCKPAPSVSLSQWLAESNRTVVDIPP